MAAELDEAIAALRAGLRGAVIQPGDDGYDAARLLLFDEDQLEGLVIAMPEQEVLWLGQESEHSH